MEADGKRSRLAKSLLGMAVALAALMSPGSLASSDPACLVYSYDGTGNRLSETTANVATATWNSAAWGCFVWTAQ